MAKDRHNKHKKNILIIWLEFIPFLLLYRLFRLLPLKIAYAASIALFSLYYFVDATRRTYAIKHLQHAGVAKNDTEAAGIARKVFMNFSMLLVEIIKKDQCITMDKVKAVGSASTIEDTLRRGGKNQNVIIVTAHYGNWELAGTAWAHFSGIPMVSVMREFENPLIGKYILRNRCGANHEVISKNGGIKGLLKALRDNKTIAILADQHASTNEGVETTFFGQPCRTHTSPALLHLKTGIPIMPEITRRVDDKCNFEFIVSDLIKYEPTGDKEKDIRTVTQMYTTALENMIAKYPEQWMWVHRRWLNIHRRSALPPHQGNEELCRKEQDDPGCKTA